MASTTKATAEPNFKSVEYAVAWLRQKEADLAAQEDVLARQMGVDPDRDILIVPARIVGGYFDIDTRWPRWMRVLSNVEQPYIVVGVKDRNSFKKGESGK